MVAFFCLVMGAWRPLEGVLVILGVITACTLFQQWTGVIMAWWLFVPACWATAIYFGKRHRTFWGEACALLAVANSVIYGFWPYVHYVVRPDWPHYYFIWSANAVILGMFAMCFGGAAYDWWSDIRTSRRRLSDRYDYLGRGEDSELAGQETRARDEA